MRIEAGKRGPWKVVIPLLDGTPVACCVAVDLALGEVVVERGNAHVECTGRVTLRPIPGARAKLLADYPELAPYLEPEPTS